MEFDIAKFAAVWLFMAFFAYRSMNKIRKVEVANLKGVDVENTHVNVARNLAWFFSVTFQGWLISMVAGIFYG